MAWTSSLTITLGNPTKKSDMDAAFNNTIFMQSKGDNIASGATTDIGAATGLFVDVTGTTTITALGTVAAGTLRIVRFTGALTLTYNATSLILPTAANITTEAGDCAIFESLGSGNWQCINYMRASGKTVSGTISQTELKTSQTSVTVSVSGPTNLEIPGGEYGFRESVKGSTGMTAILYGPGQSAGYKYGWTFDDGGAGPYDAYIQQRYVTASGEYHWVFILRDKNTKRMLRQWESPDHPAFFRGGKVELYPYPDDFKNDYNESKHEIIVINPTLEQVNEIEKNKDKGDNSEDISFLESLWELYEIDEKSNPEWPDTLINVGLPKTMDVDGKNVMVDWRTIPSGTPIKPIMKKIPKPKNILNYALTKKLK